MTGEELAGPHRESGCVAGHSSSRARASVVAALLIIGAATLRPTPGSVAAGEFHCLNCGAWLQDGLNNVLLFAPLGLALGAVGIRASPSVLTALGLSVGVELLQVLAVDGRDAALRDIVANTMGGMIGALAWRTRLWWPSSRVAARATGVGILVLGAIAAAPGWWFVPIGPDTPYFAHLDPRTAPFPAPAKLHAAQWNARDIRCCPDPASEAMRHDAADGWVKVRVAATLTATPPGRSRLLTLWDARSEPVVIIGVTSARAWASVATPIRAAGARDFAVGVVPPRQWRAGDSVSATLTARPGLWSLAIEQNGRRVEGIVRQRPLLASYLFLPWFADIAEPHSLIRWVAFAVPAVMLGWVAAFVRRGWAWAAGPLVAGGAFACGGPWVYSMTAALDLGVLTLVTLAATWSAREVQRKRLVA